MAGLSVSGATSQYSLPSLQTPQQPTAAPAAAAAAAPSYASDSFVASAAAPAADGTAAAKPPDSPEKLYETFMKGFTDTIFAQILAMNQKALEPSDL